MSEKEPPPAITRRGFMVILSSPSGAGKTTVARHVLNVEPKLELSVSVTTRPQRASEIEGKDYHFVDKETFAHMAKNNHFLEQALVYGYHYGTPKASVEDRLEAGIDILFDIDWQGTQQLKQISTVNLVSIFLLPPTLETLEARLHSRAEDREETIRLRMKKASDEMSHWDEYDYVIVNHTLGESVEAVRSIIHAERLKRRRQAGLSSFVSALRAESL